MRRFGETIKELLEKSPELREKYEKKRLKLDLGREVIELRKAKGITQEELAKLVGTRRPNISRIERGEQNVSIETIYKLVKALDGELFITARGDTVAKLSEKSLKLIEKLRKKTNKSKEEIIEEALETLVIPEVESVTQKKFSDGL